MKYFYKQDGHIITTIDHLVLLVILFLMIMPDDFFSFLPIYQISTPSYIAYKLIDYKFGIVQVLILIAGLISLFLKKNKTIPLLLIYYLLRETIFFFFGKECAWKAHSFEMILTLIVGITLAYLVSNHSYGNEIEDFFYHFICLNEISIYVNILMGNGGLGVSCRFHASNLDVGATGTLSVIGFLWLWNNKNNYRNKNLVMILCVLGLIFSGSRIDYLLFALFFVLILINHSMNGNANREKIKRTFYRLLILAFFLAFAFLIFRSRITAFFNSARVQALFAMSTTISDSSFTGRLHSINKGLIILQNHPLGISCSMVGLQVEMNRVGYPTFPHSTLLSSYLLYGPIILILYVYAVYHCIKYHGYQSTYYWVFIYLLVETIISGGPMNNFKIVFIFAMIFIMAKREENTLKEFTNE